MKVLPDGTIRCRARITGSYRGYAWVYEDPPNAEGSQYIHPDGDPSTFWWAQGNLACDCNRARFVPEKWGIEEECGDEILIDKIECLDYDGPVLELNETYKGKL